MLVELNKIADALRQKKPVEPVTVRDFLWWFGAQRRGPNVVQFIRRELQEAGLDTYPPFEGLWLDAPLNLILLETEEELAAEVQNDVHEAQSEPFLNWITRDPTYRISKLAAANQKVVSVTPDDPISKVVTLLLARDFSQLPVMTSERSVRGMVSWKTIGSRLALGNEVKFARDCMEDHHEIRDRQSIFELIPIIQAFNYVLVRAEDQTISGIITSSDLSSQFHTLSEPFLLLSEIENLIRKMIAGRFTIADYNEAKDPGDQREIKTVDDLTFGGYLRLLQHPENWPRVRLPIDRVVFCKDLDDVRVIRNNVTHFDPDGITRLELEKLRDFKAFLSNLEKVMGGV
jgi:predicted transcriptional regulator